MDDKEVDLIDFLRERDVEESSLRRIEEEKVNIMLYSLVIDGAYLTKFNTLFWGHSSNMVCYLGQPLKVN